VKEARSRLTGRYVDAEDAQDDPYLYTCPECGAPVSLRAGRSKQAYFAHLPGRSGTYCELYVEGLGLGNGSTALDSHDLVQVSELALGLRLSDGGYPRRWGLELSIPTTEFAGSEVTVDVGGGRTITVDCRSSGADPVRHTIAEPQSVNYQVLNVVPSLPSGRNLLSLTCAGLDEERATVFGEIGLPNGRIAPRVSELKLGRTYVFVWPSVLSLSFPERLEWQALKGRTEWSAATVTLSTPLADSSRTWLRTFTGLSITTSATEIIPVWPPQVRKVTAESVEAQENIDIIVHGGQYTPSGTQPVRGMFARGRAGTFGADAGGLADAFFRLAPELEPLVELSCPEAQRAQLTIEFTQPASQRENVVELEAADADGAELIAPLHEESAGALLSRVRNGELKFSRLALPAQVKGTLYTGRDGIWNARLALHASSFQAKTGSNLRLLPPTIAEELKKLILDRAADVLLDFGAFGRVRTRDRVATEGAVSRLPTELRSRLLVFLFQLQRRSPSTKGASNMTDAELLVAFSKAKQRGMCDAMWRVLNHALKEQHVKW
jgi:hypothetical protein